MATIEVYDKFGELLEVHESNNLKNWVESQVPEAYEVPAPPFTALLNGQHFEYRDHDCKLLDGDLVTVTLEPQDPFTWVVAIIAIVSAAYAYYTISKIPKNYQNTQEKGQSIYTGRVRANKARPSGNIRSIAGAPWPIYPDYITPIHRLYVDNIETIRFLLCVGRGYYDLQSGNFYIGDTPLNRYAGDFEVTIFEPGENLSAELEAQNWYSTPEVQDLKLTTGQENFSGPWQAEFSGSTITSYFNGSAIDFPFSVGEQFQILNTGNAGFYIVDSLSGTTNQTASVFALARGDNTRNRLEVVAGRASLAGVRGPNPLLSGYGGSNRPAIRRVYNNGPAPSFTPSGIIDVDFATVNGAQNWEGPYFPIPDGETTQFIEFDINFPGGLTDLDDDGNEINATVDIVVQWRERGQSSWNTETFSYTAASYDEIGVTETIDFGSSIYPEFRIRRVTPEAEEIERQDDVFLRSVKCRLDAPSSYPGVTVAAITLKITNAVSQTAQNLINIRGMTRRLPLLQEIRDEIAGTSTIDLSSAAVQVQNFYSMDQVAFFSSIAVNEDIVDKSAPGATSRQFSFDFSDDGLRLVSYENGYVKFYTMTRPFEPDSIETFDSLFAAGAGGNEEHVQVDSTGTRVVTLRKFSDPSTTYFLTVYDLSTAFDGSTATVNSDFSHGGEIPAAARTCRAFSMTDDGLKFWLLSEDAIYEYGASTAWDLSTVTYSSVSFSFSANVPSDCESVYLGDNVGGQPSKLWVLTVDSRVFYYTFGTPGDISTLIFDSEISFSLSSFFRGCIHVSETRANFGRGVTENSTTRLIIDTFAISGVTDTRATRSVMRFVANEIYEGIGDEAENLIDWDEFAAMDTLLQSRGDFLDAEFVDETTLDEAVKLMMLAGFCEPTFKEGRLRPVRRQAGSDFVNLYTPDVMLNPIVRYDEHYDGTESDGVNVEYLSDETGQIEMVECRLAGDLGIRPETINAIGITNRTRAWRLGMRKRIRDRLKPAQFKFSTEMDGLNSEYGQADAITCELYASQFGQLEAISGTTVTLDFEPTNPGGTLYAAFRNPEGEYSGLYEITLGPAANQITLVSPPGLDFVPVDPSTDEMTPTLVAIGNQDEVVQRVIISSIEVSPDETCDIVAEEHLDDLYQFDDLAPP